ncbi:MAG: hypothetical protein MPJ06_01280 [Nitrosopumilus sp.]|nr:hypothetical protein [Nitrosopumilus sp.]MDA7942628.1 hypothetical protein [Nitrosopumilus sp.]MDA7959489.1 hypothetical protein [Nitrosopumilus sp.]
MSLGLVEEAPDAGQVDDAAVEAEHFDNLVVLGNSAPDEISGGRKTVCTVVYSEERGLMRVYPVPTRTRISRWDVISAPLERNPMDDREESWKIQGSKSEWNTLHRNIKHVGRLRRNDRIDLLGRLEDGFGHRCIEDMNDGKLSLGIIRPTILGWYFVDKDNDPTIQSTLTSESLFKTYQNYPQRPMVEYRCPECRTKQNFHKHVLREWGVFEYMRKFPGKLERLWDNLRIDDPEYEKMFLVGNMHRHRRNFMVVSMFRFKN